MHYVVTTRRRDPMSPQRLPTPDTEACLDRRYPSSQKGGTLIAEDVLEQEEHERRRQDPDGYRLERCPRCHGTRMHRHQTVERQFKGEERGRVLGILVQRCAAALCRATFRMLPAFAARWLQYSWATIERHTLGGQRRVSVPARTARRWRQRARTSGRLAAQVLAATLVAGPVAVAQRVGLEGSRRTLVQEVAQVLAVEPGQRLQRPAALLHRLCPGVRLL